MSVYRLSVALTGLYHVKADSPEEAQAMARIAIEKGNVMILDRPLYDAKGTVTVAAKLDDHTLKPDNLSIHSTATERPN